MKHVAGATAPRPDPAEVRPIRRRAKKACKKPAKSSAPPALADDQNSLTMYTTTKKTGEHSCGALATRSGTQKLVKNSMNSVFQSV